MPDPTAGPNDATPITQARNRALLDVLPFDETQDFEDAQRGFIGTWPDPAIYSDDGRVVWSFQDDAFLDEAPPDTVNPSLWRQAQLNRLHGLFLVTERIYQVRGFDASNMTVIEGDTGLIVIDTMISSETALAGLDLYRSFRGDRPVKAVIFSHCHADHYGGIGGVVTADDMRAGRVEIIAPDQFMEGAVAEGVLPGPARNRRAQFQFGGLLPRGPRGAVDVGICNTLSRGSASLIAPTRLIKEPIETHTIDGVEIVFQLTPQTEAPAEMHMYYPAFRALNLAENATHTMHNIAPIRGAEVRDANAWAQYLNEAMDRFGRHADVVLAQHQWPVWGNARVLDYLSKQRDAYKFLHDQTVRLMNHGYKPDEIAERLALPKSLEMVWHVRGYYGTLSQNVKSVYQRYLGWYDANPAHLNPLPPVERGRKYVEYMGGTAAVIARAREDFALGEYRFVADVMSQVAFADPSNAEARLLGADALEQLGYAAESGAWRNAYLYGAQELRQGMNGPGGRALPSPFALGAMSLDSVFDYLGVRLNGEQAEGKLSVINWAFSDLGRTYLTTLSNSALTYLADRASDHADATVTLEREALTQLILHQVTLADAVQQGAIAVEGDVTRVTELFGLFDDFAPMFEVVEPKQEA